jgi:hypothetical protein
MSTGPKKLPSRIHKAPKRFADEQADAVTAKKRRTVASGSATPTMTAIAQLVKKSTQPSTSKVVAPSRKRAPSVEVVEDPADKCRSESPHDPTRIIELADGSEDEPENSSPATANNVPDDPSEPEVLEEPAKSAEAELSLC